MAKLKNTAGAKNPIIEFLSGLFYNGLEHTGLYYSSYRGVVWSNEDPEGLQRLQLIIPQVSGNDYYEYWAFPKNVFYGKGYGEQKIPRKGDVVWVEFEGGKPEIPIWSHGHPALGELPEDKELRDVNCYYFISPAGHQVVINDTKGKIYIKHKNTQAIEVNEKSISLVKGKAQKISLGTLDNSEYSAVLGENLKDLLEDMEKILKTWSTALQQDLIASATSPYLKKDKITLKITEITNRVSGLSAKIQNILSNLVKLDK